MCLTGDCSQPAAEAQATGNSIRYFDGQVVVSYQDVFSNGYGFGWGHVRTYCNQMSDYDQGNGFGWLNQGWPFLVERGYEPPVSPVVISSSSSLPSPSVITVVGLQQGANWSRWFVPGIPQCYPLFGSLGTLTYDPDTFIFTYRDQDGTLMTFNGFGGPFISPIQTYTPPNGTPLTFTYGSQGRLASISRTDNTTTQSFVCEYIDVGPNASRMASVTLQNQTGAVVTPLRRALYTYFSDSGSSSASSGPNPDDFGSLGDLQTVTTQQWNPDTSAWDTLGVSAYRYYRSGEANGIVHGLKYVLEPASYARMVDLGLNPLVDSVGPYADYYFEYDADGRVKNEMSQGGSLNSTYQRYTSNNLVETNNWQTKTVETRPDGSQQIVYTNNGGSTLLEILLDSSSAVQSYRYTRFDDQGRGILEADTAAVVSYSEAEPDLGVVLHTDQGLLRLTEYYDDLAAAPGYVSARKIQHGTAGTPILLSEMEYATHTYAYDPPTGVEITLHPLSQLTQYPSDTDPLVTIVTGYAYEWHTNSGQMSKLTTTLPAIPTSQNGSGTSNTRIQQYDPYGNLTSTTDESGTVTETTYYVPSGGLLTQVQDVWGLALTTDYESNVFGRTTQELGPEHTIDLDGTATTVRTATWTVYDDINNQVRTGRGYHVLPPSPAPPYDILVNPVQITIMEKNGRVTDEIQATRASTSGKLLPSDTFAQSSYVRWTTYQYTDCCLVTSKQVYFDIPNTEYDQTDYGYDSMKRRNRVVTPGGTITATTYNARGQVLTVSVGTDDSGTTTDNMRKVTTNEYDNGGLGDGNLTSVTQHVDDSTNRVTNYGYDWRNRQTSIDGEIDLYAKLYYDNLDRQTRSERYDTTASGNLIGRQDTSYDDLNRVYQTTRYAVDPSTGSVGNSLVDKTWYDPVGNVMKSLPPGSKLFIKTAYDALNRPTAVYVGYGDDTTYAEAGSVADDTILEQSETTYDEAGSVIATVQRQRYHDTTGTGPLVDPTTAPKARVMYSFAWPDGVGRTVATADYGTNGGSTPTRPDVAPAGSDSILVTTATFDDAGDLETTTDPAGMVTLFSYDDAGREVERVENYQPASSSSSSGASGGCPPSDDVNRTTSRTYNADGNLATLTASNAATGSQTTTYIYGTTLPDSAIETSTLLQATVYPDSVDGSDQVTYQYNRQSQRTQLQDQRGVVRSFDYDLLGRLTADRVTTIPTSVNDDVLRISREYEVRGMVSLLSSYDNATVGQGNIVNQVQFVYNDFSQLVTTYQEHDGAVNTSTTPSFQTAYDAANSGSNTTRPTSYTYPNGRVVNLIYTSGMDSSASRISQIQDQVGPQSLVEYTYLGRATPVTAHSPQPDIEWTLTNPAGGSGYPGLDDFNRVIDCRWYNLGTSSDLARIQYGYDRVGNRTYRDDLVDPTGSYSEYYTYDQLHRLKETQRGQLNGTKTGISTLKFAQCWTLDALGNWQGFRQDDNGDGTWDLVQARTANKVNEITGISNTTGSAWSTPQYDAAGNMVTLPAIPDTGPGWVELSVDDWSSLTVDGWSTLPLTAGQSATYDAWNRLTQITTDSGMQQNQYDGRNYRTVQEDGGASEPRHFYYTPGWQVVEERLGTSPATADAERQFVWGIRYIDDLVLRDRDTTGGGMLNERLYGMQDANWNMIAVCDASGTVQERYAYTSYGVPLFLTPAFGTRSSSDYDWETLYCGYRYSAGSELFQIRNRTYLSQIGTWLQRDPIGYPNGFNSYGYHAAVNSVDPYGLMSLCEMRVARAQLGGNWVPGGVGDTPAGELSNGCNVNIYCADSCGRNGAGVELGGMTFVEGGYIHICMRNIDLPADLPLSEIADYQRRFDALILHEMSHAADLCRHPRFHCPQPNWNRQNPPPRDLQPPRFPNPQLCKKCKDSETRAYTAQASYICPDDRAFQQAFVKAGICYSCRHVCPEFQAGPCPQFPMQCGN